MLLIKGFIVGIGKIIPGVSGAILAINFKIYERILNSITNFFDNWQENLKFLLIFGSGVLLAIILCSNIILYLLNNYQFITLMFFIGLIIGGVYNFSKGITYNRKNIIVLTIVILIFLFISLGNQDNNYQLKNNFLDNIIFFIGGIIEIFASIVPGISGTSLLMMIGIYDDILKMIAMTYNLPYVINHSNLYLSYSLGMITSFILNAYLITFLLKKYRQKSYLVILGLSISSIIFLIIKTIKIKITLIEVILGIMVLMIGLLISFILDK